MSTCGQKHLSKTYPLILIRMASLKITVFKAKALKDGRHKIRIAVCHKQETCYIVTRFIIDSLSQFKNGQVVKRQDAAMINTKLRNLLNLYQERLDDIKNLSLYSCKQIKNMIQKGGDGDTQQVTYQQECLLFISKLNREGRNSYATLLERSCRYFTEFAMGNVALSDMTTEMIENFVLFLRTKKKIGNTTIGMMISQLKAVVNRGISRGVVKYETSPFATVKIRRSPIRETDISVESLNKIRCSNPSSRRMLIARDVFMLSFYLGGINLIDMLEVDFRRDTIEYVRMKTRFKTDSTNLICIPVTPAAREIANKWMNKRTGKLDFGYKFSYHNFSRYICRCIQKLADELNIQEDVVYYSARKSFAQFASEIGIPDGVIDYCLGHSDKNKGIIRYYTKVRQRQAEIAINKVIDYVNNPEKYKDYIEMNANIMMMKI